MVDEEKLKRISDQFEAPHDESLYNLEGFEWDLSNATEACHQKLLPPVKVESSPEVPVNEKSVAEESSAMADSRRISDQSQWQEPSPEMQKELIDRLREVAFELSAQEAVNILRRVHWNVEQAGSDYMEQKFPQRKSFSTELNRPMSDPSYFRRRRTPRIGVSNSERFSSRDETSAELAMEVMSDGVLPLPSQSQVDDSMCYPKQGQIGSSSFCSMNVESDERYIPVPITYSSQVQSMESSSPPPPYKVDQICKETGVCRDEALYYLEGFDWDLASALEACRSKTLPPAKVKSSPVAPEWKSPPSRQVMRIQPEQKPPEKEGLPLEEQKERIKTVCDATGMSPDVAHFYLKRCNWNTNSATNDFLDDSSGNLYSQHISEEDHSTMGQSNSQWTSEGDPSTTEFSEDVTSKGLASMRLQNKSLPVPSLGSPSQSQFQAPGSSSSSMMNVDPTETEESLKEASDGSVPVAISPMASSQVDNKLKGKSVEEDSSTETIRKHTLNIVLADDGSGTALEIPFRSDQTIRDIRNAIDERTPDNDRDYDLQALVDDVDCKDLNVTVGMIIKRGSTTLLQVFHDS